MCKVKSVLGLVFWVGLIGMVFGAAPATTVPRLLSDGPGRKEYLLNGLYHFKVFDRMPGADDHAVGSGFFARIPGEWFDFLGNSDQFVDGQGKALPRFPGSTPKDWRKMAVYGLYEIDFPTPSGSEGQTILLNLAGCQFLAEVYCNGVRLGSQRMYENNFYDISKLLKKTGLNNLRIGLQGFQEESRPYAGLVRDPVYAGIIEDVKLLVLSQSVMCRFTGLSTDVAKGEAVFTVSTDNYSGKTLNGVMRLELSKDGKKLLTRDVAVKLAPGTSRTMVPVSLTNLRLWEPESPALYTVSLRLDGSGGMVMASIPPAETGFRQVEIKDGHFYLNGHIATLFGDSAARVSSLPSHCVGAYPEQMMACLRSLGYNFTNLLDYHTPARPLQMADRYGMMIMPVIKNDGDKIFRRYAQPPALTMLGGKKIPQEELTRFEKQFRDLNEYFVLHPSVIGYARNFNWLCEVEKAYQPQLAGRKEKVVDERAEFAAEILRRTAAIDPSKIHYNHHGGGFGPVYTHNRYWSVGLPLQEKCDFPKLWSESRSADKLPYMITEAYMYSGWPSIYPKWGVSSRNPNWVGFRGQPFMLREIGAVQLGPNAYFSDKLESRTMTEDHIINVLRQTAAYRYYGVMGQLLHTDTYRGYISGTVQPMSAQIQDNISGLVSRSNLNIWQREHPSTRLTDLGRAFRHAFSGFTFFIMGDGANPTAVEHNYYSGAEITKNLLVINETGAFRKSEFELTLASPEQTFRQEKIVLELKPGERLMQPLLLKLPSVTTKTVLTLKIRLEKETQEFAVTVFPPYRSELKGAGQVAYYDDDGSLVPILKFYNLDQSRDLKRRPSLENIRLLVIGRNALNIQFGQLATKLKIGEWLCRGGRIIVMEQQGDSLLGLALDKRRARNVFMAVPHHPVFAGLADADLADWQGKSSLLTEFPPAAPGFHWGEPLVTSTTGTVSSLVMEKPHIGNFLPLLESGYDLQFSPLLEWREQHGLLLLSQLDLTGRIGVEPAATMLFGNLLHYALTAPEPAKKMTLYAGDAAGKTFLKPFLVTLPDLKPGTDIPAGSIVIAGSGAEKVLTAATLRTWLNEGGTLLCLPSFNASDLLPVKVSVAALATDNAYSSLAAAAKRSLPVSLSDLYWHDRFTFSGWKVDGKPGLNPLLDEIPCGKGKIIYCRIAPSLFKNHYFLMKPYRLWSTLLTACGVSLPPMIAGQIAGCGTDSAIPLGNNAWFRLDPRNLGVKEQWMSPELAMTPPWKKIVVPGAWEKTPYLENFGPPDPLPAAAGYDGVGWYRFEVKISRALSGRPAILQMGVIDDYDTCYFNGVKIGGMGKAFGPNVYRTPRSYRVPEKLIRYDDKNVIVVRVDDASGEGGIMSGKLQLEFFAGKALKSDIYLPDAGIMEVFGVTPYYNEQW